MDIKQRHRVFVVGCRAAVLAVALMLAGCQAPRPDFTERSRQDCAQGDQEACRMLEALTPQKAPKPQQATKAPPARPTRIQTDVQAIMMGMEQAKLSARTSHQENIPPPEDSPAPGTSLPE